MHSKLQLNFDQVFRDKSMKYPSYLFTSNGVTDLPEKTSTYFTCSRPLSEPFISTVRTLTPVDGVVVIDY